MAETGRGLVLCRARYEIDSVCLIVTYFIGGRGMIAVT